MTNATIFLLIRLLIGLILGGLIARKLRDPIRAIILLFIPMRLRISQKSYYIQTRIATILGIVLTFAIAILWNLGIMRALDATDIYTQQSIYKTTPTPKPGPRIVRHYPIIAPEPEVEEIPDPIRHEPSIEASPIDVNASISPPSRTRVMKRTSTPRPKKYAMPTTATLPHYAQLYAFTDLEQAQRQQQICQLACRFKCETAYAANDPIPYKVLVGPFPSRPAANTFLSRQRWKGFPRTKDGLAFFN